MQNKRLQAFQEHNFGLLAGGSHSQEVLMVKESLVSESLLQKISARVDEKACIHSCLRGKYELKEAGFSEVGVKCSTIARFCVRNVLLRWRKCDNKAPV